MATGWVFHELYLWHATGSYATAVPAGLTVEPGEHAENPATKRRFRNLLEVAGILDKLTVLRPRPATEAEIGRFHTADYVRRIQEISAGVKGGDAGELT